MGQSTHPTGPAAIVDVLPGSTSCSAGRMPPQPQRCIWIFTAMAPKAKRTPGDRYVLAANVSTTFISLPVVAIGTARAVEWLPSCSATSLRQVTPSCAGQCPAKKPVPARGSVDRFRGPASVIVALPCESVPTLESEPVSELRDGCGSSAGPVEHRGRVGLLPILAECASAHDHQGALPTERCFGRHGHPAGEHDFARGATTFRGTVRG